MGMEWVNNKQRRRCVNVFRNSVKPKRVVPVRKEEAESFLHRATRLVRRKLKELQA